MAAPGAVTNTCVHRAERRRSNTSREKLLLTAYRSSLLRVCRVQQQSSAYSTYSPGKKPQLSRAAVGSGRRRQHREVLKQLRER